MKMIVDIHIESKHVIDATKASKREIETFKEDIINTLGLQDDQDVESYEISVKVEE